MMIVITSRLNAKEIFLLCVRWFTSLGPEVMAGLGVRAVSKKSILGAGRNKKLVLGLEQYQRSPFWGASRTKTPAMASVPQLVAACSMVDFHEFRITDSLCL